LATQATTWPDESSTRHQLLDRRRKLRDAAERQPAAEYLSSLMEEVDAALARLDNGTFGLCDTCHEPIEHDRLASDPLLRFCIEHLSADERRSLEQDLALSARIQSTLLPANGLRCAGWEIAYHYQPAGVVSGDYCDAIAGPDHLFFLLGDVSGKGVAASILTAHLHAMFRSLIAVGLPLERLVSQANRLFSESTMPNSYATLVCGCARAGGEIDMVNAGHCPPLLIRGGACETLPPGGLPLGLFRDTAYRAETMRLGPADRLLLFTDGVSEARNREDMEYGEDRIARLVALPATCRETADRLVREIVSFRGAVPQHDDVTVMVVGRGD
jgi:sigma-B regulation protein RsbU (phosphoserine phosphatase)